MHNLAEIKVSYSTNNIPKIKITKGEEAYKILLDSWDINTIELQEEFKVLLLNKANEVLGIYPLSKGGITGTVIDVRLIFGTALKCNATGIIICHNHPSGNLIPSIADINITKKIKECSTLLDITLIDHLIISKEGFYSFINSGDLS